MKGGEYYIEDIVNVRAGESQKSEGNRLDIGLGILSIECSHIKHWSWSGDPEKSW